MTLRIAWVGVALSAAGHANAQDIRDLGARTGEAPDPFTSVAGVFELRDGRVLVADAGEKTLQVVDLRRGIATQVAREGGGPVEFRSPGRLFAWAGDSVAMYDRTARRLLILDGTGKPVRSLQLTQSLSFAPRPPSRNDVRFVDQRGRVYAQSAAIPVAMPGKPVPDSTPLVRFDAARSSVDSIASLKISDLVQRPDGDVVSVSLGAVANPYRVRDAWVGFADGTVALVRSNPYFVEWHTDAGRRVSGAPVRYSPVRVTTRDREVIARTGVTIGGRSVPIAVDKLTDLPDVKPAFDHTTVVADPRRAVWVQRFGRAEDTRPVYDVFDDSGSLVQRVRVPPRSRIAALSAAHVYLVESDSDGFQWLRRHQR